MQIGEPLRTVVVEPLELPVREPENQPEPIPTPEPEPREAPVAREHSRLHHAGRRLPRLVVGRNRAQVSKRRVVDARAVAVGCVQKLAGRAEHGYVTHEAPHEDCTCGVYSAKSLDHLRTFGYMQYGIYARSGCGARWSSIS